jgi:hypothetical protein
VSPAHRQLVTDAGRLLAALAVVPMCAAGVHALTGGAPWLDLGLAYPAPTGSAGDALAILAHNARVKGLIAGATVLAIAIPGSGRWLALLLIAVAAINVALVSAVILADGPRAQAALVPHGPIELVAYSLAGAGFMHARAPARDTDVRLLVGNGAAVMVLLAIAAAAEVCSC